MAMPSHYQVTRQSAGIVLGIKNMFRIMYAMGAAHMCASSGRANRISGPGCLSHRLVCGGLVPHTPGCVAVQIQDPEYLKARQKDGSGESRGRSLAERLEV